MSSTWQLNRKNAKKRLRDFAKALDTYLATGKRLILKKPPDEAMVILAEKRGVNAYDFCADTLSPEEQDRRRRQHNTYQREANKREALRDRGLYKGTGEQRSLSRTQKQEEYFDKTPEEQIAAHEELQVVRDVQRGWRCPMCRNMVPDLFDLPLLERDEFVEVSVRNKSGESLYNFVFHISCHNKYEEVKKKKESNVHSVNTTAEKIEQFNAWRPGDAKL